MGWNHAKHIINGKDMGSYKAFFVAFWSAFPTSYTGSTLDAKCLVAFQKHFMVTDDGMGRYLTYPEAYRQNYLKDGSKKPDTRATNTWLEMKAHAAK